METISSVMWFSLMSFGNLGAKAEKMYVRVGDWWDRWDRWSRGWWMRRCYQEYIWNDGSWGPVWLWREEVPGGTDVVIEQKGVTRHRFRWCEKVGSLGVRDGERGKSQRLWSDGEFQCSNFLGLAFIIINKPLLNAK